MLSAQSPMAAKAANPLPTQTAAFQPPNRSATSVPAAMAPATSPLTTA